MPLIKKEDSFREFYESVGERYPEEEVVYSTLRGMLRRQFVLPYLKKFQGRFLDLGCNRGIYMSQYQNGAAVGVDIAYSVLKGAKRRVPEAHLIQGDAQNLAFLRSNSFDSILCSEMIEHVSYPQKVFTECYRILKPQGSLLVTTPNFKRKKPNLMRVGKMKSFGVKGVYGDYYFHTAFRPEELKCIAEKEGFQVVEFGTLEKEVKCSTRIPVLFYYKLYFLNHIFFHSKKIDDFNEMMLEKGSLLIYKLATKMGINKFLTSLVKEGVRSYLLAEKR